MCALCAGDMSDKAALALAFDGIVACFLGCSNSVPWQHWFGYQMNAACRHLSGAKFVLGAKETQVCDEKNFIDVACEAGCQYMVKLGTCGAPGALHFNKQFASPLRCHPFHDVERLHEHGQRRAVWA